ncbi:MAG: hypothetical protein DME53_10275 [Verrucomicrobia bacterium]|nr:MAG: hypothetical protein DME53_10275 [Verrucomicrobiota bacterium]
MDREDFHLFTLGRGLFTALKPLLLKKVASKTSVQCSHGVTNARVCFEAMQHGETLQDGYWRSVLRFLCYRRKENVYG